MREIFNVAMGIILACAILAGAFYLFFMQPIDTSNLKSLRKKQKKPTSLRRAQLLATQREQARLAEQINKVSGFHYLIT